MFRVRWDHWLWALLVRWVETDLQCTLNLGGFASEGFTVYWGALVVDERKQRLVREQAERQKRVDVAADWLHKCCEALQRDLGVSDVELADLLEIELYWYDEVRYGLASNKE